MDYKYHFIYKTTNTITDKFYIGMHSTNNIDDGYLGSGLLIKNSIIKYGKEKHQREILLFTEDRKKLSALEKAIVNNQLLCNSKCMNLKGGGVGGNESGHKHPMFGKKHSDKTKKLMSMKHLGNKPTNSKIVIVDSNEYSSLLEASKLLSIKLTTLNLRLLSKNPKFKDYYYKDQPK